MPLTKRKRQKTSHSQYSNDLIFNIFLRLPFKDLLQCSKICKQFQAIFKGNKGVFYRKYLKEMGIKPKENGYENQFKTCWNIRNNRYKFISAERNFDYNDSVIYGDHTITQPPGEILFVWPRFGSSAYLVASWENTVCWVNGLEEIINIGIIEAGSRTVSTLHTLKGHNDMIGLLLATNTGKLLSFDESCFCCIWDLKTMKLTGRIDCAMVLGNLISMNVEGDLVICGGVNSKVAVWNSNTLELINLINVPTTDGPLNIGIHGDKILVGLAMGKYLVYDFHTSKLIKSFDIMTANEFYPPIMKEFPQLEEDSESENTEIGPFRYSRRLTSLIRSANDPVRLEQTILQLQRDTRSLAGELDDEVHARIQRTQEEFDYLGIAFNEVLEDITINETGSVPRTLAVFDNIMLTNGPNASELLVWDLCTGKLLHRISEFDALSRFSLKAPSEASLQVGEVSRDGSIIFCALDDDYGNRLLLWDYSGEKRTVSARLVQLVNSENGGTILVWIVRSISNATS